MTPATVSPSSSVCERALSHSPVFARADHHSGSILLFQTSWCQTHAVSAECKLSLSTRSQLKLPSWWWTVAFWDTRTVSDIIIKKKRMWVEKKAGTEAYLSCLIEPETILVTAFYTDDLEPCGLSSKVKWLVDGFVFNYSFQVQFPSQSSLSSCCFAKSKCHFKYLLLKRYGNFPSSVIASIMIIE